MALQTNAQADVTSAYNANKQGDYAKAAEYIEKAINDPKAVTKEKTWRYRGDIYLSIATKPELTAQFPNAVQLCKESYFKSMEIDTKKEWIQENTAGLSSLQAMMLESAASQYGSNDFCGASGSFAVARDISERFKIVDSVAIYNGAYCSERCGKLEEALAGYQESAKIGYNVPSVYGSIVELYNKMGKKEEAVKTLSEARAKYPKDSELLRAEVNVYLTEQKYDQALGLLKDLTAQDPSNEMIWFVLGVTYEKLGKIENQIYAYKKAISINHFYFDALFNLGATYYNQGVELIKSCDKIPPRESVKYNECISNSNIFFHKAILQFEYAFNVKPNDIDVINALKEAYFRIGNNDGVSNMEKAKNGKFDRIEISTYFQQENNGSSVLEVPIKKEGGVYKIPVKVNGVSWDFIFDTGASKVCISLVEALDLQKRGLLADSDIIRDIHMEDATGTISVNTLINLRVISVGGREIYDVEAIVVDSMAAPLLFGQSAIERFGNPEILYDQGIIRFK